MMFSRPLRHVRYCIADPDCTILAAICDFIMLLLSE